ncbi:hypothetical protein EV210_104253 [Anaerospora hongkongensis]|uniref:Uncharacterized protein n=1 Tax=Anaerospora hongkongensis TaxID=244830 RepID=A0A4R1Q366_9FIRM|nr:hypothetical protein [Anaerospora hongkongensis]TCL38270.1 hypothetical protein EV210_104253 [Anaerospora hongkongensis]
MAKITIKKNLSDSDMFVGHKEVITFENNPVEEEAVKPVKAAAKKQPDFHSSFFTPDLQEKVGKALLEIKMQLFKEGIVDFDLKVNREGTKVVLSAVPAKPAKQAKPIK